MSDVEPTVAARVAWLADTMAEGEYRTRLTARECAVAWGLAENTVTNMASEASRLLHVPPEDVASRRSVLAAKFEALAARAEESVNLITGQPDIANAIKALTEYARFARIEPTESSAPIATPTRIVIALEEPECKTPAEPTKGPSSG